MGSGGCIEPTLSNTDLADKESICIYSEKDDHGAGDAG
jgi:hypothetical protein